MQIILQATHGVVSGAPSFFKRAFGDSVEKFENLLLFPHHFIFNRDWFENMDGRPQLEDYLVKLSRLSESEKKEVLDLLSSSERKELSGLRHKTANSNLKDLLHHYAPLSKAEETKIWEKQQTIKKNTDNLLPEDELVEDSGLFEESIVTGQLPKRDSKQSLLFS
jgi:hypothetical protein